MSTPRRVLIVEDEPNARSALRELLEAEGYLVDSVPLGRMALQRQRESAPDLILTDLGLPDLDGLSVARIAQAETGCAVLMMSGSEWARHQDLGFDLVPKPIDLDELLAKVRFALGDDHP